MMLKDGDSRAPRAIPFNTSQPQGHGREHLSSTWMNDPDSYWKITQAKGNTESMCVCFYQRLWVHLWVFIMNVSKLVCVFFINDFECIWVSKCPHNNIKNKTYRGPDNNHNREIWNLCIFTCVCICAAMFHECMCEYLFLFHECILKIGLSVIWSLFYTVLLSQQLLPTLFKSSSHYLTMWLPSSDVLSRGSKINPCWTPNV